jgi:tetratricopeptide (TPR) repeat protein
VVHAAEQTRPVRRTVALKIIRPGMDTKQVVAQFEAERQALAMMDHPNIARVLDGGATESGRPYFVMELVPGMPITRYCDRERLSIPKRLELFVQVCRAVQHAHQKGIIHRDLKPSNILVTVIDGAAVPKVIDFGVAKAIGASLTERTLYTEFHHFIGTPLYMSPEQADPAGADVDTRSDIYTLGVLLYKLLTGTTPCDPEAFKHAEFDEMRRIIREDDPPKPSTRLSGLGKKLKTVSAKRGANQRRLDRAVRGELDWIVMRALEKDRRRRYATALELARDIRRHLDGDPVEAGPPSMLYRAGKLARKHRAAFAITGMFVLLLVGASVVSTWLMLRARSAEHLARARLVELQQAHAETTRALAETERAREEARTEADKAGAVNDFLIEDLLTQAEPANSAAEDHVQLLEVLDRAASKVGERFAGRPEVEEALRRTIARTYHGLASWEKAERQWRSVLESVGRRSRCQDVGALTAQGELAHILSHRGRVDAGVLEMARAASDGLTQLLGPDHPDTLTSRNNLANTCITAGRTAEAIKLHEATLELRESRLGPDHLDTLSSRNNLATAYLSAGRTAEAIKLLEATLRLRESKLGPDHPATLTSRVNLAGAYLDGGRIAEAATMHEATLRLQESKLGPDHPATLTSRNNLADAYRVAGRTAEAIKLLEATLTLRESKLGPDHPDTLVSRVVLAALYRDAGRTAEAVTMLEATLKLQESKLGPDHPDTLRSMNNLAILYQRRGQFAEAEPLIVKALETVRREQGEDHPNTLACMNNLAGSYWSAMKLDRSVPLFEEVLRRRQAKLGRDHPNTLITMANLGVNYRDAGRSREGIALLEQAWALARKRPGPLPNGLEWIRSALAETYDEAGQFASSEPLYREALEAARKRHRQASPPAVSAMAALGLHLLKRHRYAEAEPLLRECLKFREQNEPDDWRTFNTKSLLGSGLLGQKKHAEAERLLLAGYEGMRQREGKIPPIHKSRLTEAIERLVKLYDEWRRQHKADEWRRKLPVMNPKELAEAAAPPGLNELPDDVFASP